MAGPVADEWVTVADDEWVDVGAQPADPKAARKDAAMRQTFGTNYDRTPAPVSDVLTQQVPKQILLGAALQGGAGLLSKLPAGRLLTSGVAAAKAGATKLPFIGPPLKAAAKAGMEAWRASAPAVEAAAPAVKAAAPAVAPELPAAVRAVAGPKPKLSASEVKQMMREQFGSDKGGRMLFGPAREGITAAERQALMKAGTSGGALPKAAERAIGARVGAMTPEEALQYAGKAPNAQAAEYFGSQLKAALAARMLRK